MIYPKNFEQKIGFSEVRRMLADHCLSTLGKEEADKITFLTDAVAIRECLQQTREFRHLLEETEDFPLNFFYDMRTAVTRIRIENTHLEEEELFNLRRSLDTINQIVTILNKPIEDIPEEGDDEDTTGTEGGQTAQTAAVVAALRDSNYPYPALHRLADGVATFPNLIQRIDQILDRFGHLRDTASPELLRLRRELQRAEGSISRTLYSILHSAQSEGLVDKDVTPAVRDGRLVLPINPAVKRKIKGIVHDESATGKTIFVEPEEVVEANNHIRELESLERQEVIRILTEITKKIRPYTRELLDSYHFLAQVDLVHARTALARQMRAIEPEVADHPLIDWGAARHPLLERVVERIVPLDITLTPEKHILIISGPNAGGKSVCLKTVGLLQYMLQCGLSIPVSETSKTGIFHDIMIDIGDEQSLENDLSTYSSHLLNMKNMMKQASPHTLILIDEFGTGTEPQIGGAIAESVLDKFCQKGAWGVITTHYQNLKHFADSHAGVVNGAMLYDRHEMRPLFQLAIGRPGSSFAIEIARKIGLPEDVIQEASEIVGSDYIQSDKYLQDIVRDKRYWENKRQTIHQREKELEKTMDRYENGLQEVEAERKEILRKAKEEAQALLQESNRRIENTIREIRESQAEKAETKRIRQELKEFSEGVDDIDTKAKDDAISKKIEQIKQRKERHERHQAEKAKRQEKAAASLRQAVNHQIPQGNLQPGDHVRMKGTTSVGTLESIDGKTALVVFGDMKTKVKLDRLERASADTEQKVTKGDAMAERISSYQISQATRKTIDDHKTNFHQDLDVRGMRGDEALNAVQYFIDDAILVGMPRVRILHGKGNGILRQLIRQYLATVPNVTHFGDEHVQFGGAGITVVDIG
ncbi:MAG: Smr/MutS family protein [Prevotellaceae bacterium]|nr:Smr/MutS family protein [Prevotellaceae bacterium]